MHGFDDARRARADRDLDRALAPEAFWAVGRCVNPQYRPSDEPRREDYVFEGHELQDALEVANTTLEDDVRVSEQDGRPEHVRPFVREELLKPLERWFFGRR